MNKAQAQLWVDAITDILSNRNLVTVATRPSGEIEVRTRQTFKRSYAVAHGYGDDCSVAISDSYGVMTGAKNWGMNPDRRTISAKTTNGSGDTLRFLWTVDENDGGEIWHQMNTWQEKIWKER